MNRDEGIAAAAARLRQAHDSLTPCRNLRDLLAEGDVDAAYAVQRINTGHWQEAGRRLVGRKIGLTSAAVQRQLGVEQPDYGMLYADMAYADAEAIPFDRTMQPKAEGEVAFVMGRDVHRADTTLPELIESVAYALPAIEVVGSRIEGWDISIVDTIADNASSGLYVLGTTPRRLTDFDPRLCGMVLERRGDPVSTGAGAACLGNPLTAALWLARKMVEVGCPLKEGDIVLSGALGPLVDVAPGDVLELRINGLGEVRATFEVS